MAEEGGGIKNKLGVMTIMAVGVMWPTFLGSVFAESHNKNEVGVSAAVKSSIAMFIVSEGADGGLRADIQASSSWVLVASRIDNTGSATMLISGKRTASKITAYRDKKNKLVVLSAVCAY